MKISRCFKVMLVLFGFLCFACWSWAEIGLMVDPSQIYVKEVPLGSRVSVSALAEKPLYLEIKNTGNMSCDYQISVLYTAQTSSSLGIGYSDIPDTGWIIPEYSEVSIAANSAKKIELYLEIPENKEYYNKNYQAIIEVKSKKNRPEDVFVLAAQVLMRFST